MSIELTMADDAQFEFADEDHDANSMGDLTELGKPCLLITSPDGEGVGIIGTLQEIREFVGLMARGLDIEIEKEKQK